MQVTFETIRKFFEFFKQYENSFLFEIEKAEPVKMMFQRIWTNDGHFAAGFRSDGKGKYRLEGEDENAVEKGIAARHFPRGQYA